MKRRAFLDHPTPIAIAHRGGAVEHPENTMPAFEAAVALGYRHLETDAHVSSDGTVFAFHDDALDRVTDGRGRLAEITAAVISAADAAFHFSGDDGDFPLRATGVRVPTMEELLTRWPDVFVNIDPKSDAVVEPLVDLLRRLDGFDRVCVGSFSDARLRRLRRLSDDRLCSSMGPQSVAIAWFASRAGRMPRLGADCLQVPPRSAGIRIIDRRFINAAHAAGLQVHAWTIDTAAEMNSLLDLGVDAVMTDHPRLLRDVLIARGQWHGAPVAGA
jgi:glycerophosphoryl diester phosphodiesterase